MPFYKGVEAEVKLYTGDTPEEVQVALAKDATNRNMLNIELIRTTEDKYCATVIYEVTHKKQLLMEG